MNIFKKFKKKPQKTHISTFGFILVSLGSAIGLGNLVRFPRLLAKFGGSAFLIPIVIGVLLFGIPTLLLEISYGNKWRRTNVNLFSDLIKNKRYKYLGIFTGWQQILSIVILLSYYIVLIGWALISLFTIFFKESSKTLTHILDTGHKSVQKSGEISYLGWSFLGFIFIFIFIIIISWIGKIKLFEKICSYMVALLFFLLIGLMMYSFTLPNAKYGLEAMFKPSFEELKSFEIWKEAFIQVIFSIGIGIGGFIFCSRKSVREGNYIVKSSLIVAGDILIAVIGGIILFNFLSYQEFSGKTLSEVNLQQLKNKIREDLGQSYAQVFVVFTDLVTKMGDAKIPIGIMLFAGLLLSGISSLMVLQETVLDSFKTNTNFKKRNYFLGYSTLIIIFALILSIGGNWNVKIMDILDNNFGFFCVFTILTELILFSLNYSLFKKTIKPISPEESVMDNMFRPKEYSDELTNLIDEDHKLDKKVKVSWIDKTLDFYRKEKQNKNLLMFFFHKYIYILILIFVVLFFYDFAQCFISVNDSSKSFSNMIEKMQKLKTTNIYQPIYIVFTSFSYIWWLYVSIIMINISKKVFKKNVSKAKEKFKKTKAKKTLNKENN